jgi:isopentenyldiphosphate isomerase
MTEYLQVVDCFNRTISGSFSKKEVHLNGIWHRTINFLILDKSLKNIYFQSKKPITKNFILNVNGGHLQKGECQNDGFRELEEELGIKTREIEKKIFLGKYQISVDWSEDFKNREFMYFYLLDIPNFLEKMQFTDGEVKGIFEIPVYDAISLLKNKLPQIEIKLFNEQKVSRVLQVNNSIFSNFTDDQLYYKLFLLSKNYLEDKDEMELVI